MVIQRWQSVLLLCACVVMACFSFCNIGQIQTTDFTLNVSALGLSYEGEATAGATSGYMINTWYLFAVSITSALLALIAIFCFKNFKLQKSLCIIDILFVIVAAFLIVILGYNTVPESSVSWTSIVCAPILALVADIMAYNRICSDHRKLRDVERFR